MAPRAPSPDKKHSKEGPNKSRFFLAAAAAATAFAVGHLAGSWRTAGNGAISSFSLSSDPRVCDVRVGCTPAQLAAKRKTPKAAGRKHAFASVQQAWGFDAPGSKGIDLIDVVDRLIGKDKLKCVVNLGALDGYTDDPTYPLFKRGACGAAFEGDEAILDLLEENLAPFRSTGVAIMKEYAHPSTMASRLRAAGITVDNLDVLKVDVDGFDLALARSILEAGFRPKVVLMESNTDVPAPFTYETAYRHDYGVYFHGGFYGTSTAAIASLFEPYGYSFILADNDDTKTEHNVYLARDDLVELLPDAPRDVCSIYYDGMRKYHCIHACHVDVNFEGINGGKRFDTTKVWTEELASSSSTAPNADAARERLVGVWNNAARKHEEVIGGHSHFNMDVLKYVDVASCGAGYN